MTFLSNFFCLLFFSCLGLTVHGQSIRVTREKAHPDDDFLLPSTVTTECANDNPSCSKYNASRFELLAGCWCQCQRPSEGYTFFEPSYSCIKVSDARHKAGCNLLFTDETAVTSSLTFFPRSGVSQKLINVPANKTCSFHFAGNPSVQYLNCEGAWREIPSSRVKTDWEMTSGWTPNQLQIRAKGNNQNFIDTNNGRIFRVAVQCRDLNSNDIENSTCAMFKVDGRNECPFPQPLSPGQSATLPPPTVEVVNTTSGTLKPLPTSAEQLTTGGAGTVTSKITAPMEGTTGGSQIVTSGTTQPSQREADTGSQTGSKRNTFIITGAVAGGILFIALILLILWRCNNPKKRELPHYRLEGSISRPVSQMNRHSVPVYADGGHLTPYGEYSLRASSIENPAYRRATDGVILGPQFRQDSLYSDSYPYGAPPRPPQGKRGSMNGQINPALTLGDDIVTMNPLYEGQLVDHRDLDELNCSDFAVYPEQMVLEDRKDPFPDDPNQTYDCPEEILNTKVRAPEPVPVYYVVDDPYPDSISSTFGHGEDIRGRPDGNVYDEPEVDLSRDGSFIVLEQPNAVAFSRDYDDHPRGEDLPSTRRSHGILKVGSTSPNGQRYHSHSMSHA